MRGTVDFGLSESTPGHSALRYWDVFEDCLRLYASAVHVDSSLIRPARSALEGIAPILWECDGDIERFVLAALEDDKLHERRLGHPSPRFQSLSAVCNAVLTGKHAGYVTTRLAISTGGFSQLRALPGFDIPVRYWLFGSQQDLLGEAPAVAVKEEARMLVPSA